MKSRIHKFIAALALLLLMVRSQAQNASLRVSVGLRITDLSQSPNNAVDYGTNLVATGKSSFLSPITVSDARTFGTGRATALATGQAGKLRCRSTGGYDYIIPNRGQGGYTECMASVSVEDDLTVVSSTLPPDTVVTLSVKLSLRGTVSAPESDQRRPGITADLSANFVSQTSIEFQSKTTSHLRGNLGDLVFDIHAKVGETFRMLYSIDATTTLGSNIPDYRDLTSDGYTSDQGATLFITPQDPVNVSLTAASGYDYSSSPPPPPGGSDTDAAPFVAETDAELAAPLDADADGKLDFLVIDKATGLRRLGVQQPDGSFQWADPVSTGLDNVTGLGIGRFAGATSGEGFAVAAPLGNQVAVFPDAAGESTLAPSVGIGPSLVVGLNFGGDTRDDLVIGTIWDKSNIQSHLSGLVSVAGGFNPGYGPNDETGPLSRGNRARLAPGGPWFAGALRGSETNKDFVLRSASNSTSPPDGPTLIGLAADTEWAWGRFQTNDLARFLFYSPGTSNLYVPAIQGSAPGPFSWAAGDTYPFDLNIRRITVVPAGSATLLLIVFDDGNSAATYDFDGVQAPVLRQKLSAPSSLKFSIGGALANGDFILLSGPEGGRGTSSTWQHWGFDGMHHKLVASGNLPALNVTQARANVLLFGSNPDLDPAAPLLRMLRVGEWSDSAVQAGGKLHVVREQFLGPSTGLGSPGSTDVPIALSVFFPAVNQRALPDSMVVLAPPAPFAPSDLSFSPTPGTYPLSAGSTLPIQISSTSGDPIQFRTTIASLWILYDPLNPPRIDSSRTLQAFVDSAVPGPIRSAPYVLAQAPAAVVPASVDANHNGLPDAWEQAFGVTDPQGDPDGDGATNLQEYLAGTDPLDAASVPPANPGRVDLVARSPGVGAPDGTVCEIAWPASVTKVLLESTEDIGNPASWSGAMGLEVIVGTERVHYEPAAAGHEMRFYRLRAQP